jgi:ABC-type spermidine/putrescine transport system permease subunit I
MRGLDVKRIANYERIVPIFMKGAMPDGQAVSRQGTAPIKVSYLQVAPLTAVFVGFFILPITTVIMVSFFDYQTYQLSIPTFTLQSYADVFASAVTYRPYLITLRLCMLVWALTLLLGFPIAYFLAFHVGYIHLYTLFMTVPIFNAMIRMDRALLEAAGDSGATEWQTLWHVIVPLCKPGIVIGSIFVIAAVMGDFVTVNILGGGQIASVGKAIVTELLYLQFPPAAANAMVLLMAVLLMLVLLTRLVDIRKEL